MTVDPSGQVTAVAVGASIVTATIDGVVRAETFASGLVNPWDITFLPGNEGMLVTETDDAGAIYKGRNPSCRGNIIRHTFVTEFA